MMFTEHLPVLIANDIQRPKPVPRPPLPPFPDGSYQSDLPWQPPRTRDYLRADAWGVTIPNLPWVPGASSIHPERCLSWFLDRWSSSWQDKILTAHAQRDYTHFILSAPDSLGPLDNGPNSPPGAGRTLAQFVETCRKVRDWGFYPVVFLGSKYFQVHDMNNVAWIQYVSPILEAVLPVASEVIPGWEWDEWNTPGDTTIYVLKAIGAMAHNAGVSCWTHYTPHRTSWQQDGTDRFRFWDALGDDIDGLMYQTQAEWSIEETQARCVDTLWWFGLRNKWKFRFYEDQASRMFDGEVTEDDANLRGYLGCCTTDDVLDTDAKVWGFGNGARMPDGTSL